MEQTFGKDCNVVNERVDTNCLTGCYEPFGASVCRVQLRFAGTNEALLLLDSGQQIRRNRTIQRKVQAESYTRDNV